MENLSDPDEIHNILKYLIRARNRELLVFLPTVNTFYRYEREDIIRAFKEEAEHGIKVRILMQRAKDGIVRNGGIL
jgi:sugar-specific transcriptional regulator TrmB